MAVPPEGAASPEHLSAKARALSVLSGTYLLQGNNPRALVAAEQSVRLYRQRPSPDPHGLSYALIILGQAHFFLGRRAEAEAPLQESLALARVTGDVAIAVFAVSVLVRVMVVLSGDLERARSYAEEALRLSRVAGLDDLTSATSYNLGLIAAQRGNVAEARQRFEETLAVFGDDRMPFNIALVKSELAHLERKTGNHARALELYRETMTAFRDMSQRGAVAHQLECFAFIATAQQQFDRAVRLLGAAEAWREQAGTSMTPAEQIEYQQQVQVVRAQVDAEWFSKIWAEGRALTLDQAIHYATEVDPIQSA